MDGLFLRQLKPKICKAPDCDEEFIPRNSMTKVCSLVCARDYAHNKEQRRISTETRKAEKARRRAHRAAKDGLRTARDVMPKAQAAVNAFVRARDYGKPCISCNRLIAPTSSVRGQSVDAGHYRSRGAASHLRFNLWNLHGQCVQCNRDYSGNVVDYRICLIRRIGEDRVITLENDNAPRKFDVEYLDRIKRIFNRRARHYRKLRGIV